MANPTHKSVAVLGGGVTGLAAAHRLAALGHRVRLFEAGPRTGGVVRTEIDGGWLVESGPNTLSEVTPELSALFEELGIAGECLEANAAAKKRYLVRGGRLLPVPSSLPAFLSTPLFTARAKARLLGEVFARKRSRAEEVSVADFVREHFGREILDYAMQPIVSGIFAGDPGRLSVGEVFPKLLDLEARHGSLIRGQIASMKSKPKGQRKAAMISFRRGLQVLPDALAAALPAGSIALNAPVRKLSRQGGWKVAHREGDGEREEEFDAVVSTLPAPALSRLEIDGSGRALAPLGAIDYPALSSLFLGFARAQVPHPLDGFGVLVPYVEGRTLLGVLFSSTLFPGRAPEGHVALTVMVGGALQSSLAARPLPELLVAIRADLRDLLGVTGDPVFQRHAFWPNAIAQYNIGHGAHREAIAACERAHPGLFIGGQVKDGVSVAACIAAGRALADRAASELR